MANSSTILAAALLSLAGTEWGPQTDSQPERFIQFKDNDVAGSGGCNRFVGRYTFDGATIKIGPLASTRMACVPEVMDAEQRWFRMLERASTADATAATLVLKDESGTVIATLRRRDAD